MHKELIMNLNHNSIKYLFLLNFIFSQYAVAEKPLTEKIGEFCGKAYDTIKEKAKSGKDWTQFQLSQEYAGGKDVEKRTFNYAYRAAKKGYAEAEAVVGEYYAEGRGVEKDFSKAYEWTKKAVDARSARGLFNLGC